MLRNSDTVVDGITSHEEDIKLLYKNNTNGGENNNEGENKNLESQEGEGSIYKSTTAERERNHSKNLMSKLWDRISDYRSRLVIYFATIILLAAIAIFLIAKTVIVSSSDSLNSPIASELKLLASYSSTGGNHDEEPNQIKMTSNNNSTSGHHNIIKIKRHKFLEPEDDLANTFNDSAELIIIITTLSQLNSLNDSGIRIHIKSLEDEDEHNIDGKSITSIKSNEHINTLIIDASISEDLLSQILSKFSNVSSLTLNVRPLCSGATYKNVHQIPPLELNHVKYLKLVNCQECPIVEWILNSKIQDLTRLGFCNSIVNRRIYESLSHFLRQSPKEVIVIDKLGNNVEFCAECDFEDEWWNKPEIIIRERMELQMEVGNEEEDCFKS